MADALHKLNREQLLQLLYEQSKELEDTQKRAAEAEAKVSELTARLEEINTSAVAIFQVLEKAREAKKEAKAEAKRITEQAQAEADRLLTEARRKAEAITPRPTRQSTFKPRGQNEDKQPATPPDVGGTESGT